MNKGKADQRKICEQSGSVYYPVYDHEKVGISNNVIEGIYPLNGLRHMPTSDTSGWYIWAGEELSGNDDFFKPLHIRHIKEWRPEVEKYLCLAPGWRFLIAKDYEDIWFDSSLLEE